VGPKTLGNPLDFLASDSGSIAHAAVGSDTKAPLDAISGFRRISRANKHIRTVNSSSSAAAQRFGSP
jgi:hypothetical protein